MNRVEVWVLDERREVLVTDIPGPPASVCGFVSQEVRTAAEERGYVTVSEIGFPRDCFLGGFDLPEGNGWGKAFEVAEAKAQELGYRVVYESAWAWDDEDEAAWEEDAWYMEDDPWEGE